MEQLRSPHLILFAYNWGKTQNSSQDSTPNKSWESLRNKLNIPPEADTNSTQYYPFTDTGIAGFYQRISLGDTDGLLVICSTRDEDNLQDAKCLHDFREKLEVDSTVGKTWLILSYVNSTATDDHKNAAEAAYQAFKPTSEKLNVPLYQFIDCSIFEAQKADRDWKNPASKNEQILICICPDKPTMEKVANFYYDWLWLFYYQHKTAWAYKNSRQIKQLLEKEDLFPRASTIPDFTIDPSSLILANTSLPQLKQNLQENSITLSKHTTGLESLSVQLQTLKTNLTNYQSRLATINKKTAEQGGKTNLTFLENFSNLVAPTYQAQIEQDINSLTPGVRVRENYLNTIRVILEISQAESDRRIETQNTNFQNTIAVAGVGLGIASLTATAVSPFVEAITQKQSKKIENGQEILIPVNALLNFGAGLIISILFGVGASFLVAVLLKWKRSR